MSELKIGIICGHGQDDPGATSKKYGSEKDLVRKFAPYLVNALKRYKGVSVKLLNTNIDWFRYLQTHSYNFSEYDYIMELHANSGAHDPNGNGVSTGFECYVTPREQGHTVEDAICSEIADFTSLKNRGVKRANFYVINCVKDDGTSGTLFELGFIDDADDMEYVTKHMTALANCMARGVGVGFKLKTKSDEKHNLAEYLNKNGNKKYINVYPDVDKIEHTKYHGRYNTLLTIGTNGARNVFNECKDGYGSGTSSDTKEKGTTLLVKIIK